MVRGEEDHGEERRCGSQLGCARAARTRGVGVCVGVPTNSGASALLSLRTASAAHGVAMRNGKGAESRVSIWVVVARGRETLYVRRPDEDGIVALEAFI